MTITRLVYTPPAISFMQESAVCADRQACVSAHIIERMLFCIYQLGMESGNERQVILAHTKAVLSST